MARATRTADEKRELQASRTRRRFARRQWARRWLTWRYLVAVVIVLVVVCGSVYAIYFSDALSVQGVEVSGTHVLSQDDVLAAADVPTGRPLATVDLVAIDRRVSSLAAVRAVEVSRRWPHDVVIKVIERVPVAIVDRAGDLRAVDSDGVVFDSYRRAPRGLPRIETGLDTDVDALREGATVVAALPDEVRGIVDHVELVTADQINLELRDVGKGAREVRWGSSEQSEQKAEVLLALLKREARVYDVSVPGQPTTS